MSFITKRERVFNEYELIDLPARNEGMLKAYASCTDARAWSHFCSDKSEHLVEIIKRNNEICRPKYLPTSVIVDTLMVAKNTEIVRLKEKIREFEQMLAAYDQLDLTCQQKCEIAEAHQAIRAANKELDDMYLDLDLSGFTEAPDSEAFETGKSKGEGDEEQPPKKESKSIQMEYICNDTCDAQTHISDPRIEEMQDSIINKDAKLNAMKNTMAVLENDVCEPYCIYAHIYTALEKIYGALSQNGKYRQYLNLMMAGKDTRCIDIKGKILFKLKVLEKFSIALIAPCNEQVTSPKPNNACACYRLELDKCETNYTMPITEINQPLINNNKRAHLVADIMRNDEMKEILSKESISKAQDESIPVDDSYFLNDYNINAENLARLKNLQENYDDLMVCYESLKHEKESLEIRCHEYEDLEKELHNLKLQVNEYNSLWNEKEHYRKRSADLDTLKEQYLILTDETGNVETQLKAAAEINHIKSVTIDELRNENLALDKKMNDALIAFEKEKNSLMCKLKEADCTILCQGQQIKSLSTQIDRFLDQEQQNFNSHGTEQNSFVLMDEVESHKDRIKNLKEALFCNEEEKQNLEQKYHDQLKIINDLKNDVEEYKSAYEKSLQRIDYLEKYTENLLDETQSLTQEKLEKKQAIENLLDVINTKSQQIDKLMAEAERRKTENKELDKQIYELRNNFNNSITSVENEKKEALRSLQLARQESQELFQKVKDYDYVKHLKADVSESLEMEIESKKEVESLLKNAVEENNNLKADLASREKSSSILLQEIQNLRELNSFAVNNVTSLLDQNNQYKDSIELTQKESSELKFKIKQYENLTSQLQNLQISHDKLVEENNRLKNELDSAILSIKLCKRESEELIGKIKYSENSISEFAKLQESFQKLAIEKHSLQKELSERNNDVENLIQSFNNKILQNEHLLRKCTQLDNLDQQLQNLRETHDKLLSENQHLQNELNNEKKEFAKLYDMFEKKNEENRELCEEIKSIKLNEIAANRSIQSLREDNLITKAELNVVTKESVELLDKIKHYEALETEFKQIKTAHDQIKSEKEKLQRELDNQLADLKRIERENFDLQRHSQTLITHSEDLENALISSRTQILECSSVPNYSIKDILKEIEQMRKDKLDNQKKIRDLLDKLDESENIISNLSEDVLARDDRIAILENHINELEDEARKLHVSLAEVIDTSEQMKEIGFTKLDSIKNMEAHHSKATHNMKMELAKLQHQNANLGEQLSVTQMQSEESFKAIDKYETQLRNLKDEREIIITEIKQLELKSVGDSKLAPNNCYIDNIILSLDRIRKSLDAKNSKSASLEQTILKVQTSSQLLLSKADEAKKIVEKEKQKIINEKEEAIKDRQIMEKQLLDLKEKLENQIANDKIVIQDLESTILNQKLIINKLNQSTQEYIAKLKEELQTLQNLYQNSMAKISELQEKLQNTTEDKNKQTNMLEKLKINFDAKSKEVSILHKELDKLNNKTSSSVGTQYRNICKNIGTNIDKELLSKKVEIRFDDSIHRHSDEENENQLKHENISTFGLSNPVNRRNKTKLPKADAINEVQVLTANVEPTFDYVRNSYMNYKITRLSIGRIERYSISRSSDNDLYNKTNSQPSDKTLDINDSSNPFNHNSNLVDIYNRQSMHTNSSKDNSGSENLFSSKGSQRKSSGSAEFGTIEDSINDKYAEDQSIVATIPDKLPNKDLFVIYNDGQSTKNNTEQEQGTWSEVVVESVAVYPKKTMSYNSNKTKDQDTFSSAKEEVKLYDQNAKRKLKITLPVIKNESNTVMNNSDDKNSSDSYSMVDYIRPKPHTASDTKNNDDENGANIKNSTPSLPSISNEENFYRDSKYYKEENTEIFEVKAAETDSATSKKTFKISNRKDKIQPNAEKESHHKLSRVEANVLLLKNENGVGVVEQNITLKPLNDDLDDTFDGKADNLNTSETKTSSNKIRISKSDENFNLVRKEERQKERFNSIEILKEKTDNIIPSFSSHLQLEPTNRETTTSKSSKTQKTFAEKSIMVKLDSDTYYENTIVNLTKTLEITERDYKKKIEAIKVQYDNNIKSIINDHNQGVKNIQGLHEDTLQDIIKMHENEVENLRSMSMEAMRKAELLEKENRLLKMKIQETETATNEYSVKALAPELRKRPRCRKDTKLLTKTTVEAFNVKPKARAHGPCTCSLDVNISDTIRNIFEQVDVEQRKLAEHAYIKYIATKIANGNIENLDVQELSFLHLKVCRIWKTMLSKEEVLQKKIESLETELLNKQRNAQQHFAELDRKVAEERRRLQEVREAVCRSSPGISRTANSLVTVDSSESPDLTAARTSHENVGGCSVDVNSRGSAGDLVLCIPSLPSRRNNRNESNMTAPVTVEERRERKLYNDEPPTRLRRSHDRQVRSKK